MKRHALAALATVVLLAINAAASGDGSNQQVSDTVLKEQRKKLEEHTKNRGFGPQSPRDIEAVVGSNSRLFTAAPKASEMNLCNIHFHNNAEHKGGEFTQYVGNGDGHGYQSGYRYSGTLNASERQLAEHNICQGEHGGLNAGDTIEAHYVHSTAQVKPGPTLASCLNKAVKNPQLRVETQVYVLVNDPAAADFMRLTQHQNNNGLHQAVNIPGNTGTPVEYAGSTTGPGYNEKGSPFHVTWSVRPKVAKVTVESVGVWCKDNIFNEDHAHGVRNLVVNPELLSVIE
tara:strand:+ start:691 stop:1551 length:861 start_codon:yes stop_codon:yes gene_type:complete